MAGNSFGTLFRITTFGESHGLAMGAIVDGCPPGLILSEADIQVELDRRRPGQSNVTTQRKEADTVKILSGIFENRTTGTPIALMIENQDAKSKDYEAIKDKFRPGHADYTYQKKYGTRDYRGGGRASARETAMWVACGAIAKKYLNEKHQVTIQGYLSQFGDLPLMFHSYEKTKLNPFFCANEQQVKELHRMLDKLRREKESVGAKVSVLCNNVPVGLGEPVFSKLDADIAHALMGINAAKAIEIGDGVLCAGQKGSEHRDEIIADGFLSNHAGGVLGGISTGQPIFATVTFKPTSSIPKVARTMTTSGHVTDIATKGRHDPCVGIRAVPVVEAMMALVLMDHLLRDRAQNFDVERQIMTNTQLVEKVE